MKGRVATIRRWSTNRTRAPAAQSEEVAAEVTSQAKVTFSVAVLLTVVGIFAYKKYWKGGASKDVDEA